jgi:hypothetical protein
LPSHSGHRAVVHRSRSETCRARVRHGGRLSPNSTAETDVLIGPGRRWPGLLFFGSVMAMTARVIPILAVAIMIGSSLAYGSPACMTEGEAHAKFPKAHLIWLGTNHCWTFAAAPVRHPPRAAVPAPSPRPALAAAPVPFPRPEIVNSGIDAGVIDAGAQCRYLPCE